MRCKRAKINSVIFEYSENHEKIAKQFDVRNSTFLVLTYTIRPTDFFLYIRLRKDGAIVQLAKNKDKT